MQTETEPVSATPTETLSISWGTALIHETFSPETFEASAATASIAILGVGSYLSWRSRRLRRSRRIAEMKERTISGSSCSSSSHEGARRITRGSAKKSGQLRKSSVTAKAERRRSRGGGSSNYCTSGVTKTVEEGDDTQNRAHAFQTGVDCASTRLRQARQKVGATQSGLRQRKSGKKGRKSPGRGVQDIARLPSARKSWNGTANVVARETSSRRKSI